MGFHILHINSFILINWQNIHQQFSMWCPDDFSSLFLCVFIFHASCPHIRVVHGYDPLWIVAGVSAGLLTATVEQVKNNLLLSTYNAMVQADVISGHSQISFIYLSFQFFFSINISKKKIGLKEMKCFKWIILVWI